MPLCATGVNVSAAVRTGALPLPTASRFVSLRPFTEEFLEQQRVGGPLVFFVGVENQVHLLRLAAHCRDARQPLGQLILAVPVVKSLA